MTLLKLEVTMVHHRVWLDDPSTSLHEALYRPVSYMNVVEFAFRPSKCKEASSGIKKGVVGASGAVAPANNRYKRSSAWGV